MIKIVVNNIKGDINIKINEKDIFEQDTLVNINEIYKNSLNVLSFELDLVSLTTKEMKDSSFYWCHTYDIHRDDGIKGTVLYYFINELIKELVKLDNEIELHTNFYIPNSIKSILINNGAKLTTSVNLIDRLKYFFRYNLGSIKYLVKYLRLISIKSKIIKDLDIVLFTNIESNIKRWRGFPDTIVECGSDLNLIDNQLMRLKNYNTNEIYKLNLFNINDLKIAFFKSLEFHRNRKKVINNTSTIINAILLEQTFTQTTIVYWRYFALNNLFKSYKIKSIYVISSFGDPYKRLIVSVANMFNIKVNIFACRPYLSEYRCEDIIINSDYDEFINEKNKINFIVLDTHSKLHLSRYSICSELYINTQYKNISVFKDGILLLFTDRNFNQKLMNVLENVDLSDVNVYVRQHPFESITNEIHNRLNKVSNKIMFIDQLDWKEITFQNVYTIVSNSTSAVDANISGCNIIWAPFLSHNFLQFIPHSQMFGTLISSHDELAIFLKNISFK